MKNYTFHVSGTHCTSCKILIEDSLNSAPQVSRAEVNLKKAIVVLEADSDMSAEALAQMLTEKIKKHGYALSVEKMTPEKKSGDMLWQSVCIGLSVLAAFFLLQKSGVLNLGIGGKITPTTSFIIGIIASLSSCLAVVGGLVLSLSAQIARDNQTTSKKPLILFHAGRLGGFALFGGLLGLAGEAIGINFTLSAILGLLTSAVMIMLGLQLLGVLKNIFVLPNSAFLFFRKIENGALAPILIGMGTFFLPCGFTQSMQFAALSSGSFFSGLLIMTAFALGTLPVLAFISFESVSFARSKHALLFFKSAGVIVLGFGAFALLAGLAGLGIINPLFSL